MRTAETKIPQDRWARGEPGRNARAAKVRVPDSPSTREKFRIYIRAHTSHILDQRDIGQLTRTKFNSRAGTQQCPRDSSTDAGATQQQCGSLHACGAECQHSVAARLDWVFANCGGASGSAALHVLCTRWGGARRRQVSRHGSRVEVWPHRPHRGAGSALPRPPTSERGETLLRPRPRSKVEQSACFHAVGTKTHQRIYHNRQCVTLLLRYVSGVGVYSASVPRYLPVGAGQAEVAGQAEERRC